MKIKARCKFKLESDGFDNYQLRLIMKFKDPTRIFKVKRRVLLEDECDYNKYSYFLNNCLGWLDKNMVEKVVKEEIQKYFGENNIYASNMKKLENLTNKIKDFNKEGFEVEVEIEE